MTAALFLASVILAASWSEDGHRIVCAIARKELGAEARVALASLLEDDSAVSFPEDWIWADPIPDNRAYDWARPRHYVNVNLLAGARPCPRLPADARAA